ncbi:MAG: eukaryotic-like serine/threonine-protein kinase [Verrucomicrobiota bacterium]|jgi:tetratricopeptide (TPR) repeat protein/tRNA A-37 threonylcarbamoyl transferase component Bud32
MKTLSPGLSDSIASVVSDPRPCPHCDSSSHIAGGLCVGCLLEAGLDPGDESESEALSDILAEVRLPDQNWRLGNYEILEEIGRGGMGVIYRARQRHSRRIVAVKRVLSYHSDSRETLARFRREAQAAASLDHPNILPIYEVSESEDGLPFFSMKFAPGGTLQQVASALRTEPRQCVALVAKIARAVQYAHSRGILHRDLKPGNILLDARGEPLVSDFGLAKWLDTTSDLTRTLTIFGTPGYIAPEQASAAADELKPTADIYSLGAILFDLLAGRPPFLGAHALSVIRQAAESPAPKLRTLTKLADRDLETICSRCLEREPSARYPSAHDLAEDLERWLEGRSIIARPISPPVRVWRWSKRNRKLSVAIWGCLIFAAFAMTWQWRNRHLEITVRQQIADEHALAVLPILDLDIAGDNYELSARFASLLGASLNRTGPARVVQIAPNAADETALVDLPALAAAYQIKLFLSGTRRTLKDGKIRFVIRVINPNGELVFRQTIDSATSATEVESALNRSAPALYSFFSAASPERSSERRLDPAMRNGKASEFLLAGRELMERQSLTDLDRALHCFEQTIRLEPSSALARAYYAISAGTRLHYQFDQQILDEARTLAERAEELNPELPEVHRALSGLAHERNDLAMALEEAYQAIELGGPQVPVLGMIGICLKTTGQPQRAITWFEKMSQWRRRPADASWMIGDCWADLGDDNRAEAIYRRISGLHPELPEGWLGLCRLHLFHGEFDAARLILRNEASAYQDHTYPKQMAAQVEFFARDFSAAERLYTQLASGDRAGGGSFYGGVSYRSALGILLLARGDKAGGGKTLEEDLASQLETLRQAPTHPSILYQVAALESSLGREEDALSSLRQAFTHGWLDYRSLGLDPRFDGLRGLQGYRQIVRDIQQRVDSLRQEMHK